MSTELMASRKNKRSEASRAIAQAIIDQYRPTNADEMQDALKDILKLTFRVIVRQLLNHRQFLKEREMSMALKIRF